MKKRITERFEQVAGLDLGDRMSQLCVLDAAGGEVIEESRWATTEAALRRRFEGTERLRIALEVGTHSPWIARLLERLGHEVWVANPRKLRLIYENRQKDDRVDAEYLARLARLDPRLLSPVQHRGAEVQTDLAVIRARAVLVTARSAMIHHCRGAVKSVGARLPAGAATSFPSKAQEHLPESLRPALEPLLEQIGQLTERIRRIDARIERMGQERYPETTLLQQIHGVGPLTALTFILTLEDPQRFRRSRTVGAYLGLVPARADSGQSHPQLRITKQGDRYLRTLLVQCAHYILGPFGHDCQLRRFGERLVARGGRAAKKRAVIAVARKLAVLLHHLWVTAEVYDPFFPAQHDQQAA